MRTEYSVTQQVPQTKTTNFSVGEPLFDNDWRQNRWKCGRGSPNQVGSRNTQAENQWNPITTAMKTSAKRVKFFDAGFKKLSADFESIVDKLPLLVELTSHLKRNQHCSVMLNEVLTFSKWLVHCNKASKVFTLSLDDIRAKSRNLPPFAHENTGFGCQNVTSTSDSVVHATTEESSDARHPTRCFGYQMCGSLDAKPSKDAVCAPLKASSDAHAWQAPTGAHDHQHACSRNYNLHFIPQLKILPY